MFVTQRLPFFVCKGLQAGCSILRDSAIAFIRDSRPSLSIIMYAEMVVKH
jgi:hypothetical protein